MDDAGHMRLVRAAVAVVLGAGALTLLASAVAASAPPGPTNLKVRDVQAASATLTWTAPRETTNL
jgi:hypothetical protein